MNDYLSDLLFTFFTIGMPECIAVTVLALTILKQKYHWGKILLISLLFAFTILLCRVMIQLNGIPGIHSAVATVTLALLIALFYRVPKHKSLIVSIVCMVFITICEFLVYDFFSAVFALDTTELIDNKPLWLVVNWVHIIALAITAFTLSKTKWYPKPGATNEAR